MSNIDNFLDGDTSKPGASQIDNFLGDSQPPARGFKGWGRDIAATAVKGAIGVPETLVGLADIPTGGAVGKFLENEGGTVGFRPKQAKELVNDWHSDATKAAQQKFQNADGFVDKAVTAIQNPSLIAIPVGESLPIMGLGSVAARGLMAAGARGVSAAAGGVGPSLPGALARTVGEKAAPIVAGGLGEGITMAGSAAEQIRQETPDGRLTPTQSGLALATGALGTAFGIGGGKLASRLGVGDVDTMISQGSKGMAREFADDAAGAAAKAAANPLVDTAEHSALRSIPASIIKGAISEGFLEELPQSVAEQVLQNIALGKDWSKDVDAAAVMGVLSGSAMGGPAAGFHGYSRPEQTAAGATSTPASTANATGANQPATSPGLDRVLQAYAAQLQALQDQEQGDPSVPQTTPPDGAAVLAQQRAQKQAELDAVAAANRAVASPDDEIFQSTGANEPAPIRPSVAMGLDPAKGSLTAGAAIAVDTGAAGHAQQAAAMAQAPAANQSQELDPQTQQSLRDELQASQDPRANTQSPDNAFAYTQEDPGQVPQNIDVQGAVQTKPTPTTPPAQNKGSASPSSDATTGADQSWQQRNVSADTAQAGATALAVPPTQQSTANVTQATEAQQSSPQQAQAGTAPATNEGLSNATTPSNNGTQAQSQAGAPAQAETPEQRAKRVVAAGKSWDAMGPDQRKTVMDGSGAKSIAKLESSTWERLGQATRETLADAMMTSPAPVSAQPAKVSPSIEVANAAGIATSVLGEDADAKNRFADFADSNSGKSAREVKALLSISEFGPKLSTSELDQISDQISKSGGGVASQARANAVGKVEASSSEKLAYKIRIQKLRVEQAIEAVANARDIDKFGLPIDNGPKKMAAKARLQKAEADLAELESSAKTETTAAPATQAQAPAVDPADNPQSAVTPAKTGKKPSVKDGLKAFREARAEYFTPGNVLPSYGGTFDRVVSYTPPDSKGDWSAEVQEVEPDGNGGYREKMGAPVRVHSTNPSEKELNSGPKYRAPAAPVEVPAQPDQAAVPTGDAAVETPVESKQAAPEGKKASDHLGVNSQPISEGGKPFKTRETAKKEKNKHPTLRVVKVKDGFVLAPKTALQLAADEAKSKRLSQPNTSPAGEPIPAHAFIAASGSLNKSTRNDLGIGDNPRIGNRTLFAASGGLSIEQATEKLIAEQYLPEGASHNDAYALIRKSLTTPQYNSDGIERIAQAEQLARYGDYLAAQEEDSQADPFDSLDALDLTEDDAHTSGYDESSDPIKMEVNALLAQADALGIDTETIKEEAHEATRNGSEQDYFEAQRSQLQAAIRQGDGSRSNQADAGANPEQGREAAVNQGRADRGQDAGQQGSTAEPVLTSPTREEIEAKQDRADAEAKRNESQRLAAEMSAAQDEDRKRIAEASEAAASTFTLGGDAMDNLTGQGNIFDAPAEQEPKVVTPPEVKPAPGYTSADAKSAEDQLAQQLGEIIDKMTAGDVNKIAARYLPEVSLKATVSKTKNKAMLLDFTISNPFGVAAEFGFDLPDSIRGPLEAKYEGRLADASELEQKARETKLFEKLYQLAAEYERAVAHRERAIANGSKLGSSAFDWPYQGKTMTVDRVIELLKTSVQDASKSPDYAKVSAMVSKTRPEIFKEVEGEAGKAGKSSDAVANDTAKPDQVNAKTEAPKPVVSPDEFPLSEATRSYDGISQHGATRARSDRDQFVKVIQDEYDAAEKIAETPEQRAVLESEAQSLKEDYLSRYKQMMGVRSSAYSGFFVGRSNLNVKQADKRNSALDKANDAFGKWLAANTGRIKSAVLSARNADQLAAVQAAKDAKAAEKERRDLELMGKLLAFKNGDDLRFGAAIVTRVSMDKDGYPNTVTVKDANGAALISNKISLSEIFGGKGLQSIQRGKQEIRRLVDLVRSNKEQGSQERPPAMSRSRPLRDFTKTAMTQASKAVEATVRSLTSGMENAPNVVVAFDMNDSAIPDAVRRADKKQRSGGATGTPEGFFHNGTVYLIASKLKTTDDVARVFAHEALGHYGLRGVFGDGLKPILQQIATMRKAEVDAKIKEYGLRGVNSVDRLTAAEEVLAEMAQKTPTIGFVTRTIAAIRTWLRANVMGLSALRLSDAEIIRSYILPARGWVERGVNADAGAVQAAFSRGKNDAMTNSNVVGNQGGRSADDSTPGPVYKDDMPPERDGFVRLYHGGTDPEHGYFTKVPDEYTSSNVFDGFFASTDDMAWGAHGTGGDYFADISENKILSSDTLKYEIPDEDSIDAMKSAMHWLNDEDVDLAYDAVIKDRSHKLDSDDLQRIFRSDNDGEASWEAQRIRGNVAKKLGYDAVEMDDEHGTSYLIVQGVPITRAFSRNESPAPTRDGAQPMFSREDQTKTEAFKRWFGDSKVVDEDGKPLVVYHGSTSSKLDSINPGYREPGAWFTRDIQYANDYSKGPDGEIYSVFLRMSKPMVVTFNGRMNPIVDGEKILDKYDDPIDNNVEIVKYAMSNGYDGVIFPDGNFSEDSSAWVVFKPNQIKSSTENNGEFDTENDGIRFSRSSIQGLKSSALDQINRRETVIAGETGRTYTTEQQAAMRNVGFMVERPSLKERAQALWQDAGKKMAQGIVDQFAPVKEISKDAYALLRLSKGSSGAFETLLKGGKLKLSDGVYDFDDANKGGVVDVLLTPLNGEHHDFLRWVAANRAERLMGEDREHLFTKEDIAALKTLTDGDLSFDFTLKNGIRKGQTTRSRAEAYRDSLATFNAFNKNVMDMAEQSGLIDPESRATWESEFYVPFYRVADEESGGVRGMNIKGSVVRQQAFKHLKGGKQALNNDLLDNTLMNWAHLLDASAKNRAAKATLEAAAQVGAAIEAPRYTLDQIGSSIGKKNGMVWFMDEGKKRHFMVDDPYLLTAVSSLEYAGMNSPIMNALGSFKHALTIGVTASPFFKVRNLIRDSIQVIGSGPIGYNPAKNIAQGWKLTDPKADAYFKLLAGGGTIHFGTMLEGSESKRIQALVESGVDESTILNNDQKVKAFFRKFIEPGISAYNELGNRGEAVNRAALYDQLVKQGKSHAEASLMARDLMDFSMQGSFTTVRFLSQVVPFFNARLQGMYKLGRAAKEDPKRMAYVTGAVAMASLALMAGYGGDDDWKKREDWDRNNFWWFKFGDMAFRIPKPFEIGAIGTLAERSAEYLMDDEMTGKRFRDQVLALLGDNLSMNPIPQAVKPIMDVYANKDSFKGTPIENMGMERLKSEYRFNDRTSMTARATSTALNSVTGLVGKEALSPVQVDHLIRGYFGWLGTFAVSTADTIARTATSQPVQATPDYWRMATGGMVSDLRDAPSRYVSSMYDQSKALEQAYGTWHALRKSGKTEEAAQFLDENRKEITSYPGVQHIKTIEGKMNERIRQIEQSNMDPDAKREAIRSIRVQKESVAKNLAGAT